MDKCRYVVPPTPHDQEDIILETNVKEYVELGLDVISQNETPLVVNKKSCIADLTAEVATHAAANNHSVDGPTKVDSIENVRLDVLVEQKCSDDLIQKFVIHSPGQKASASFVDLVVRSLHEEIINVASDKHYIRRV